MGRPVVHFEVVGGPQGFAQAESLGGSRMMGPEQVTDDVEIGQFLDPEGHMVGVVRIPE